MQAVFQALAGSTVRAWYLVFCFVVMVLPMIALSWWYHSAVRKTRRGRELVATHRLRGRLLGAARVAEDIAAGGYGAATRQMQNRVYWLVGCWLIVVVISFGILIWADEVNRAAK